jgi:hypothetical protein
MEVGSPAPAEGEGVDTAPPNGRVWTGGRALTVVGVEDVSWIFYV